MPARRLGRQSPCVPVILAAAGERWRLQLGNTDFDRRCHRPFTSGPGRCDVGSPFGQGDGRSGIVRPHQRGEVALDCAARDRATGLAVASSPLSRRSGGTCASGDPAHVIRTAEFPLPQPQQNPITLLSGHRHDEITTPGSSCVSTDFDQRFERIVD